MEVDYELLKKKEEARNIALNKISYRIRTEKEIRDLLEGKKISEDLISDTISFLKEYDYLNDKLYVKAYFKDSKAKLKGERRIFNELKIKGISEEDIREGYNLLKESDELISDYNNAFIIYNKMKNEHISLGKELDDKFKGKVIRRLISKGFSNDVIMKVIKDERDI